MQIKNQKSKIKNNTGLTLLEVLMAVVVVVIAIGIVLAAFNTLNRVQAVDKSAEIVVAVLNEARSKALSSEDASQYGVHIGTDEVVLFVGSSYSAGAGTNISYDLNPLTETLIVTLASGGSDVVFERLTGETDDYGTIEIILSTDPSVIKVVNISATGISEVQR